MTQAAASGQQLPMSSASLPPPKTREDVIALLEEIRIFSQLPVPFRLGDLHEKDCLIEDGGDGRKVVAEREKRPPPSPLTTQITAVVDDAASKSPSKSPPKLQQHDQQGKSYARLMFNFPSTGSGKSRSIRLPPEIKPTQVMKMIQVKREKGGMKAKRSTIITTFKKAPPSPGKQMLPPCADFFSRMNSCRAINSMKAKLQLKLQQEAEEQAKKRRAPATRTRNRQNLPPPPPPPLPSSNSNSPLLIPFTAYNPLLETPPPSCKSSFDCSMSSSGDEVGLGDEVFSPMSNLSSSSSAEIISAVAESSPMPDATESNQQQPAKQAEDDLFLDLANVDFEGFDEVFPTTTSNDLQQQDFLAEWLNDGIPLSPPLTTPPPHY